MAGRMRLMQWHRQACKTLQQKHKPGQCQTFFWDDAVQTQKKLSLYHTPTQQLHQKRCRMKARFL